MIELTEKNPHGFPPGRCRVSAVYVQLELTYLDSEGREVQRIVSNPMPFLEAAYGLTLGTILARSGLSSAPDDSLPAPDPVPLPVPKPPTDIA